MFSERGWRKLMLEEPEVWGAQELSGKEVTMRIVAKTAPMRQWEVARELRARVKAALDAAGVAPAGPDTIVITAPSPNGGSGRPAASPALRVSVPAAEPVWEGAGGGDPGQPVP
jgi:moderate conductance mechanosensitive channel